MSIESIGNLILRFAERFGVPVVLLCLLLYMLREAAIGLHVSVVKPVVESHQQFLDVLCEESRKQSNAMSRQAEAFSDLVKAHEEQTTLLRQVVPTIASERRTAPAAPQ